MAVHDPTAANVSLWARYLEEEWGNIVDPRGERRHVTHAVAAAVAGWLTVAIAPRIARMYGDNLPRVNGFIEQAQLPEEAPIPAEFRRNELPAPARACGRAAIAREAATTGRG
jgi:hypothetical protein